MASSLSAAEIAYQALQAESADPGQVFSAQEENDQYNTLMWLLDSPTFEDSLDLVFPSDEAIL